MASLKEIFDREIRQIALQSDKGAYSSNHRCLRILHQTTNEQIWSIWLAPSLRYAYLYDSLSPPTASLSVTLSQS